MSTTLIENNIEKRFKDLQQQVLDFVKIYMSLPESEKANLSTDSRKQIENFVYEQIKHLETSRVSVTELREAAFEKDIGSHYEQQLNLRICNHNPHNFVGLSWVNSWDIDKDVDRPILDGHVILRTYGAKEAIDYAEREKFIPCEINDEETYPKANYDGLPHFEKSEKIDILSIVENNIGNLAHPIVQSCIEYWQLFISEETLYPEKAKIARKHIDRIFKATIKAAENEKVKYFPSEEKRVIVATNFVDNSYSNPLPIHILYLILPYLKSLVIEEGFPPKNLENKLNELVEDDKEIIEYIYLENNKHFYDRNKEVLAWVKTIDEFIKNSFLDIKRTLKSNNPKSLINLFFKWYMDLSTAKHSKYYRSKAKKLIKEQPDKVAIAKSYLTSITRPSEGTTDEVYFYIYDRPWTPHP